MECKLVWNHKCVSKAREFDLKSQVWFQPKIARPEVKLPLYQIHFEPNYTPLSAIFIINDMFKTGPLSLSLVGERASCSKFVIVYFIALSSLAFYQLSWPLDISEICLKAIVTTAVTFVFIFSAVPTHNWRLSCKKGVYRILADFHFLQDRANFWQTDLFWHEKHRSVIVSVDLRFVLQK